MTATPDFERYADQKSFNETIAPGWRAAFEEAIGALDAPRDEVRFLDLGCGDGKYFRFLVREGLSAQNVHGLEVSRKRVERCHALGWENARHMDDPARIPYPDDSFDIVNFMEVIEHVPADVTPALLDEISRVLAPSGRLLISTPNYPIKRFYDLFDAVVHRKWDRLKDDPTHITFYNHKRLTGLLEGYFGTVTERPFKDGFIYKRVRKPVFRHKMFFLCGGVK